MDFDVLIIGGGVAGMSCALVLGSAVNKPFALNKSIGIIMHQKSSALDGALFNNALGIPAGTKGKDLLESGKSQLSDLYPHIVQVNGEKVDKIQRHDSNLLVSTNKTSYTSKNIVVAVGPSGLFNIEGLNQYIEQHSNLPITKNRIQLRNIDHKVAENIYVAGVLAGWRSQYATAAGSGAHVATEILTLWNDGQTSMVHDSEPK